MEDCSSDLNVYDDRLITCDSSNISSGPVDYNSLKLHIGSEFDDWRKFVEAVDEFQKRTLINLTITDSKRIDDCLIEDDPYKDESIVNCDLTKNGNNSFNESQMNLPSSNLNRKRKFDYKYLKLTCKYYSTCRSVTKRLRSNVGTRKIKCPTYIYASLDHYRQILVIKQMRVSCNHELKDDQVLLPKLLKFSSLPEQCSSSNGSSECLSTYSSSGCKRLRRHTNAIKMVKRPSVNALLSIGKIRCNHKPQDVCQASRLTNDDLTDIQSKFSSLSESDQNVLLSNWIRVEKDVTVNKLEQSNPLQLSIHLPTINGNYLPLCCDTFIHILAIPIQRIHDLICEQLKKTSHREVSIKIVEEDQHCHHHGEHKSRTSSITSRSKKIFSNYHPIYTINLNNDQRSNQNDWKQSTSSHNSSSIRSPVIISEPLITKTSSLISPHQPENNLDTNKDVVNLQANDKLMDRDQASSSSNSHLPSIKVSQITNGFSIDIDCEVKMKLQGISLINNSKTVKLIIEPE